MAFWSSNIFLDKKFLNGPKMALDQVDVAKLSSYDLQPGRSLA
jgi:hypothetical protein